MRRNGDVATAGGLLPFGHLGWGYREPGEFDAAAADYLADGVAQGQWVEYVGADECPVLEARLKRLPGGAGAIADGRVRVQTIEEFCAYTHDGVVDPVAAVGRRVAAVAQALDRGFTGVRAIVDCTEAARTEEQRSSFGRFEYLVDRRMATDPVSALCGYDLNRLGETALELICLHPVTGPLASPFRLFAADDDAVALAGELDLASRGSFQRVLRRLEPLFDDELVIDLTHATFVEHQVLTTLDAWAAERNVRIVVRNAARVVTRMIELLGLEHVRGVS